MKSTVDTNEKEQQNEGMFEEVALSKRRVNLVEGTPEWCGVLGSHLVGPGPPKKLCIRL